MGAADFGTGVAAENRPTLKPAGRGHYGSCLHSYSCKDKEFIRLFVVDLVKLGYKREIDRQRDGQTNWQTLLRRLNARTI